MTPVEWLEIEAVLAAHDASLAVDGGSPGLRDKGLLESALERPRNRYHYEGVDGLCDLAATYAVGLAKNHPFVDGNKRTAFMSCAAFLLINGQRLTADQAEAAQVMLDVAAGAIDVDELANWLKANTRPR